MAAIASQLALASGSSIATIHSTVIGQLNRHVAS